MKKHGQIALAHLAGSLQVFRLAILCIPKPF